MVATKYSKEIIEEICKWLRAGNNITDACSLVGISRETYYEWQKVYPYASDATKKAEIECKARNIAIIQKAAQKTWQASAWYLERKYQNEFALKRDPSIAINNADGKILIQWGGDSGGSDNSNPLQALPAAS